MSDIDLSRLIKATVRRTDDPVPEVVPEKTQQQLGTLRRAARARLVAQEYVRNGMNLREAYTTVTGRKVAYQGVYRLLGKQADIFLAEVATLVERSDIDRDRALGMLWAMFNTSILDFFDEHGNVLSIRELKKLPRVMQIMLSKVEIRTKQELVLDPETGKVMMDDNGVPYLRNVTTHVKIEIPEKMAALQQLAQLMRWTGPTVNIVALNVGHLMADAEDRTTAMGRVYEQATKRVE